MLFRRNHVARLQKRSKNIFNVFNTTVNDLSEVNKEIEVHKQNKKRAISRLEKEHDSLHNTQTNNSKMITKINSFLND